MTQSSPVPAIRAVVIDDLPAVREILFAALAAGELGGTTPRDLEHLLDDIPASGAGRSSAWPVTRSPAPSRPATRC